MYFEVDNNKKYMVIDGAEKSGISEYEIKMLKKNQISPFLKMDVKHVDNRVMYYYDVTSLSQLSEIFSLSKIRWNDVAMICEGIALMANKVEEYMLDLESVKINMEYIFLDLAEKKIYFTYYPKELSDGLSDDTQKSVHSRIKELFEYILEKFDHDADKEYIPQIYEIYRHIIQKNYNLKNMTDFVIPQANDLYTDNLYRTDSYAADLYKGDSSYRDDNLSKSDNMDSEIYKKKPGGYFSYGCSVKEGIFNKNNENSKNKESNDEGIKKNNISNNKIIKAAAIVIGIIGVICITMADMLPFKVNNMAALIMIGIGVLLFEYARDKKV